MMCRWTQSGVMRCEETPPHQRSVGPDDPGDCVLGPQCGHRTPHAGILGRCEACDPPPDRRCYECGGGNPMTDAGCPACGELICLACWERVKHRRIIACESERRTHEDRRRRDLQNLADMGR
jgi:hypothetical protein